MLTEVKVDLGLESASCFSHVSGPWVRAYTHRFSLVLKIISSRPSLVHQLLSVCLRRFPGYGEVLYGLNDHLENLLRKPRERWTLPHLLGPPVSSLGRYIGSGEYANMRVDQEHGEDLSVARLGVVKKLKMLDLVLENIGKGQQAAFTREDRA
jgi:hypothetical protein